MGWRAGAEAETDLARWAYYFVRKGLDERAPYIPSPGPTPSIYYRAC